MRRAAFYSPVHFKMLFSVKTKHKAAHGKVRKFDTCFLPF